MPDNRFDANIYWPWIADLDTAPPHISIYNNIYYLHVIPLIHALVALTPAITNKMTGLYIKVHHYLNEPVMAAYQCCYTWMVIGDDITDIRRTPLTDQTPQT